MPFKSACALLFLIISGSAMAEEKSALKPTFYQPKTATENDSTKVRLTLGELKNIIRTQVSLELANRAAQDALLPLRDQLK